MPKSKYNEEEKNVSRKNKKKRYIYKGWGAIAEYLKHVDIAYNKKMMLGVLQ